MKKQTHGEEPEMGMPKEKAAGPTAANSALYNTVSYSTGHNLEPNLIKSTPHSVAVVQAKNGGLFVDSNTMALLFGRSHKNLMRGVDKLVSDGAIDRLKIEPIFYQNSLISHAVANTLALEAA